MGKGGRTTAPLLCGLALHSATDSSSLTSHMEEGALFGDAPWLSETNPIVPCAHTHFFLLFSFCSR